MRKQNINLLLLDGVPSGPIKVTYANWTGLIYKIPRSVLNDESIKNRVDLNQNGIYFLFGKDDDKDGRNTVYIGQANSRKNGLGLHNRLVEHTRNKDYWNEAVVVTTFNNSLGATEISYLEHHLTSKAREINRYIVKNNIEPSMGNVTEEVEAEMAEFLDKTITVIGVLGHKLFESIAEKPNDSKLLYTTVRGTDAKGRVTTDGFAVLKGSRIANNLTRSCPSRFKRLRKEYQNAISEEFILTDDLFFTSPSSAVGFVGGSSLSGNVHWKDKNGVSLGDLNL